MESVSGRATNPGSIWRKWDLHVHVPGTHLNNQYGSATEADVWDRFCKIIHDSDVDVIGITDYFDLDSYFRFRSEWSSRYPDSNKVFFPNLELRLDTAIHHSGSQVNMHLIFPNTITNDQVDALLSKIKTSRKTGRGSRAQTLEELKGCRRDELKRITVNFDDCVSALTETFDDVTIDNLEDAALIVLSSGKDGLSPGEYNTRKGEIIDNIDQRMHAVFGNPTDAAYWLDVQRRSEGSGRLLRPHPTFFGCDAHSFEELEKKLGGSGSGEAGSWYTTWVKADPTWQGLLQTLIEPETRVRIQAGCPDDKFNHLVIESVEFSDAGHFPAKVCFNSGLNAIIGSRSSGKSALLAHIAYAVSPEDTVSQQTLAGVVNPGPAAGYKWEDGTIDRCTVNWRGEKTSQAGSVVYVPQNLLNGLGDKPLEVKRRIEPAARKTNEQLFNVYDQRLAEREAITDEIHTAVTHWFRTKHEITSKEETLRRSVSPESMEDELRGLQDEIARIQQRLDMSADDVSRSHEARQRIDELEAEREAISAQLNSRARLLKEDGSDLQDDVVNVTVQLNGSESLMPDSVLENLEKLRSEYQEKFRDAVAALLRESFSNLNQRFNSHQQEIEQLNRESAEVFKLIAENDQLTRLQGKLSELETRKRETLATQQSLDRLNQKLASIETAIDDGIAKRDALETRLKEEFNCGVQKFEEKLDFKLEISFSEDQIDTLSESLNQRSRSRFISEGRIDLPAVQKDSADFLGDLVSESLKLKKHSDPENFARVALGQVRECRFAATMDGDTIGGFAPSTMTPGKQALFALTLVLSDAGEPWPLLLDQPEDDLDSRSIYTEVVAFLRSQRERRQILMVTHNANLVVGSDADSVLVANRHGDDRPNEGAITFDYRSGALEDSGYHPNADYELDKLGIRQHVVDILDGGEEAFRKRQMRYKLPPGC